MRLNVVGSGRLGLTMAACFADMDHSVTAVDIDQDVVNTIASGEVPFHEPGLRPIVQDTIGGKLEVTSKFNSLEEAKITFVALPTPVSEEGSINLRPFKNGIQSIGEELRGATGHHTIAVKSAIPPGTAENTIPLLEETSGHKISGNLSLVVNPEFIREGSAVEDFRSPNRVIMGANTESSTQYLKKAYSPLLEKRSVSLIETGLREAEMMKYANNAFLAAKVSLVNEFGNICKEYNIDAYEIAEAIGLDGRVSPEYLRSGIGWGGKGFHQGLAGLADLAQEAEYKPDLINSVTKVNKQQINRALNLLEEHIDVCGKHVGVLGLAFKPGTDDVERSQSIPIIDKLLEKEANPVVYDPIAMPNVRDQFPRIGYANSPSEALEEAHGVIIVTEWNEFAGLDEEFDLMAKPIVIDGRRVVKRRKGIVYEGLTW